MNDPHVEALIYRVKHSDTLDYSEAEPLVREEPEFRLTVEAGKVRFEFWEPYATEEEAKNTLKDYIDIWEFDAALERGDPDAFRLEFEKAEIIDRDPSPERCGVAGFSANVSAGIPTVSATLAPSPREYPSPPSGIAITPDVETMHHRYMGYRKGK